MAAIPAQTQLYPRYLPHNTSTWPQTDRLPKRGPDLPKANFRERELSEKRNDSKDTIMLNRTIYHKIKNEISILKGIVYRIIYTDQSTDAILANIIDNIEDIVDEMIKRRKGEEAKLAEIPAYDYKKRLEIISQTAYDIADLVNNQLAVIESKIRRVLYRLSEASLLYPKLTELLEQIESTQSALNDLKSLNEGLKIHVHRFKVQELFETWRNSAKIEHATILLDIQNGSAKFEGDEPKIRGFVNELIENSLKHNPVRGDLVIRIASRDVCALPKHVRKQRRLVASHKKYLAITISDNGQGIPPDKKEWIFLPLNTTSKKGSGLGLFIIKKTLEAMNGYILETGTEGARFEIYIPYNNGNGGEN